MPYYVTFSKPNNYFKYILLSALFLFLHNIAYGNNYNEIFERIQFTNIIGLFIDVEYNNFKQHYLIHQIFCYLGTLILAFIFNIFEKKI